MNRYPAAAVHRVSPQRFAGVLIGLLLVAVAGCGDPPNRMLFKAVDRAGGEQRLSTQFRRAVYHRNPQGLIEVVLKTDHPSTEDPTQTITQILYLRQVWNPRLGASFAETSQLNARLEYAILSPPTGVRYDGSAFISYKISDRTHTLDAEIESGSLSPRYQMGDAVEPFPASRITGTIEAVESPREVINALQLIERTFTERLAEPPPPAK